MTATYAQVLQHRFNGSEWSINDDDYDAFIWNDTSPKPTKKQLDDLKLEVEKQINDEIAAIIGA